MGRLTTKPGVRAALARWTFVGALSASMALFGGGTLANADTTVVSTPTVAPATVATVAPTTVATVAPTTVATVAPTTVATIAPTTVAKLSEPAPVRVRLTEGDPCIGSPDTLCPVQMGVKFVNQTEPTAASPTFRVGDRIDVTLVATSAVPTDTFGFSAYLDFNNEDYDVLVNNNPVSPGANGVFTVPNSIGGANVSVMGNVNTYSVGNVNTYSVASGTIGRLDLDVRTTLSAPSTFIRLGSSETTLATITLRVKRNGCENWGITGYNNCNLFNPFEVRLRPSQNPDNQYRNSVITGNIGSSFADGRNIMSSPMTQPGRNGIPTFVRTYVELLATSTFVRPARVGDVIPVDVILRAPAGETVRYVNAVQASIKVASPSFRVVNASGTPIPSGGAPLFNGAGTSLVTTPTGTFSVDMYGNPVIRLDVTGATAPTLNGATPTAVVGRFYVKPLTKLAADYAMVAGAAISINLEASDRVGERGPGGSIGFAPTVVASNTYSPGPYYYQCNECSQLDLGEVRGTSGLTLAVRSPMADAPALSENAPTFIERPEVGSPFAAVNGRYVDVAITFNGTTSLTQNREANRFDIDIRPDLNVIGYASPTFEPAPGVSIRPGTNHAVSAQSVSLRLSSTTVTSTKTELGRLRFTIRENAFAPALAHALTVLPSTRMWVDGGPITDIYASNVGPATTGEFDKNAAIRIEPAASLQVGARLQGRRASDPSTRFIQPIDVILRKAGTTDPATRLLAPPDKAWTFRPVSSTGYAFRTSSATPTFAASASGCTTNWQPPADSMSNVVLATSTFVYGTMSALPCQISDIEPGMYDVYVKGQSSLAVLVTNVPFLPGQFRTLSGLVLREGDVDPTDSVDAADFSAFSAAYNALGPTASASASFNWNSRADLNQSGFVDILDFSLLAMNYGANQGTVTTLPVTLGLAPEFDGAIFADGGASRTFTVKIDTGTSTLRRASVTVRADRGTSSGTFLISCAPNPSTCTNVDTSTVRLTYFGNSGGQVSPGAFSLITPFAGNSGTLIMRLEDAEGIDASGAKSYFAAPDLAYPITVIPPGPDVAYDLAVTQTSSTTLGGQIYLRIRPGTKVTEGIATITYPASGDGAFTAACENETVPSGVTCVAQTPSQGVATGTVTFTIQSVAGLIWDQTGPGVSLGVANFTITGGSNTPTGTTALNASFVTASSVRAAAVSTDPMSRLAEDLQAVVRSGSTGPVGVRNVTLSGLVAVTIMADRDIQAELAAVGAVPGAHTPNHVHTARVPVAALQAVASIAGVSLVSTQPDFTPRLDQSLKASGVVKPDGSRVGLSPTATATFDGAGTIVAVIDTGIDFTHEDFRNEDGTSRILAIWDQGLLGNGTTAIDNAGTDRDAPAFNHGTVCRRQDLNSDLVRASGSEPICQHQDTNGHGTHVASIAAGKFGVAPKADILVVNSIGLPSGGNVIEAFQWVVAMAAQAGKPVSVNNSWGGHYGPHDGSDATSVALDGYAALPGVAMMVAAGNEGQQKLHTSGSGTFSVRFVPQGATSNIRIWYDKNANFSAKIVNGVRNSGLLNKKGSIALENASFDLTPATVTAFTNCAVNYSTSCLIKVELAGMSAGAQEWSIDLTRIGTDGSGEWHAWVADESSAEFVDPDYRVTLDEPAVARGAITVGAWTTKRSWKAANSPTTTWSAPNATVGSYARFSSIGPTRDGRLKPEVSAPGEVINAALSRYATDEDDSRITVGSKGSPNSRIVLQGTSMASPHVAGVVALLLQANSTLTTEQIKAALIGTDQRANTTQDSNTMVASGAPRYDGSACEYVEGNTNMTCKDVPSLTNLVYDPGQGPLNQGRPLWNNRWGYGKTNFAQAISSVATNNGGSGSGGGGGSGNAATPVYASGTFVAGLTGFKDGGRDLTVDVAIGGSGTRSFFYSAASGTFSIASMRASSVRSRTAATSPTTPEAASAAPVQGTVTAVPLTGTPNSNLWVRTDATDIKPGDIIPIQVGVTTGTRAIDGAQIVLKAATGTRFVDREGNPVTGVGTFDTGGVLPNVLRQAFDAGRNLLQVALGRTFMPSVSGVAGEGILGTAYLQVTGPVSGDLVTFERQGSGQFTTMVAGDGDDLTGSLVGLSATVAVNAPVDPVSAPTTSAPIIGGTAGTAYVAPAPASTNRPSAAPSSGSSTSAPSGPARAGAPSRSGGSTTSASARPAIATTRGLSEDRDRGTITVSVPGRAPIDLKTGTLAMPPDQYCPVLRHQTYVRLDDVGIAGATFGVEAGGVLSWVSPDQAGCVNWTAISEGGLTFTKETIMQFQLARAVPGALLWVLDGSRNGELYEVDANGIATYVTAEAFAANQDHFTKVWANVIPVSTAQVDGLALRGAVSR